MQRDSHGKGRLRFLLALLLAYCAAPGGGAQADPGCTPAGGTSATVAAVNERGELVLADGRQVKLAAIDIPPPVGERAGLTRAARDALSQWLAGHAVMLQPVFADSDRWNRLVAQVFAPPDYSAAEKDPPTSAAEVLVDAGLARAVPVPELHDCVAALLALEAAARRDALGLWADPYYAVIDASDAPRLADRSGMFVLVEGRVSRVGHGRARIFIDFGPSRDSLTVVLSERYKDAVEASGLSLEALVGVRLRVRGILDTRSGPRIEVLDPEQIERP